MMLLVTGAKGQLGTELSKLIPNAIFTDVAELDITNTVAVNRFVKNNGIDTIVNCAAYTNVDRAEVDVNSAYAINSCGPANLAQACDNIIHISTDYVFDGTAHKPYTTFDLPNPLSVYGKTKLEGEQNVLAFAKNAIVIRTSWLYSPYGNNFVKTMRRLGMEKDTVCVVADQIGTPTYAGDLAAAIVKILPQMNQDNRGVYHFSNEGVASWYDFATEIIAPVNPRCNVEPIPSSEYKTPVKRPFYSVLDKSKIKEVFDIKIQHWKKGLEQCVKQF